MSETIISFYKDTFDVSSKETTILNFFLDCVKSGKWSTIVNAVRNEFDPVKRKQIKVKAPAVTISGHFSHCAAANLIKHSGYLAIDLDDLGDKKTEIKNKMRLDPYVYSCFESISANGLCVIFHINPKKHLESFLGLQEYFANHYSNIVSYLNFDEKCKNINRLRYVSYDQDIYINENEVPVFSQYPEKKKEVKINRVIYVKSDFDRMISDIVFRGVQIAETYDTYLRCGFALADHFGEQGRDYFHDISRISIKYEYQECNRQYDKCLRAHKEGKKTGIATLYHYASKAGIEIYSKQTTQIIRATSTLKKSGVSVDGIIETLQKKHEISPDQSADIVKEVYNTNFNLEDDSESVGNSVRDFLSLKYDIEQNIITNLFEIEDKPLTNKDLNTIYEEVQNVIEVPTMKIKQILNSNFVKYYNPFERYFRKNEGLIPHNPEQFLDKFFLCLDTDNREYLNKFSKKWMVSIIHAMLGEYSPLMHILCGDASRGIIYNIGIGKTYFYRNLLPKKFHQYITEDKLESRNKVDNELVLVRNLLVIMQDIDNNFLQKVSSNKALLDATNFDGRASYDVVSEKRKRIAVFSGTSNDINILQDATGNRRYLPFIVHGINNIFNETNKDELLMACYQLYRDEFDFSVLKKDILELEKHTGVFKEESDGLTLFKLHFKPGQPFASERMTLSEIRVILASKYPAFKVKLSHSEVQSCGFPYVPNLTENKSSGYWVQQIEVGQRFGPIAEYNKFNVFPGFQNPGSVAPSGYF